ncbi:MAG: AarF/ABC1/UbiB kinase family protein [Candidatus Sericytochromatia bacterium]|nr:AarF/ABC1/UbiB kinase family protein [Candidatus Sericytochromatia bacterium]
MTTGPARRALPAVSKPPARPAEPLLRAGPDPWRGWKVAGQVVRLLWLGLRIWLAVRRGRRPGEHRTEAEVQASQRRLAGWVRDELVALGPTFIKVGQALSTRVDLLPLTWVEEMAHLQDRVPPFETALARRFIEEELGRPVEALFRDFPAAPIAAASLGQVYRTWLPTGEEVAVKVQRPELLSRFAIDLAALRLIARWVERWTDLAGGLALVDILDEFDRKLHEEIDYRREADHADRFRENFARFPGVAVPAMYRTHSSRRVLTMTFMHGIKVTDLPALRRAGIDPPALVRHAVHVNLKQLLEDGFYHADLHPGNVMVDANSHLIFLDFGLMGEIPRTMQLQLVDTFLHLVDQDVDALVNDMAVLGFIEPGKDPAPLKPTIRWILDATYSQAATRPTFREMTEPLADIFYRFRLRVPVAFSMIIRTLISLEGIGLQLDPRFHAMDVSIPFAAKLLLSEGARALRDKFLGELFKANSVDWGRLVELIRLARRDPSFRLGEVASVGFTWVLSPEAADVRERLAQALLADRPIDWERLAELLTLLREDASLDLATFARQAGAFLLTPEGAALRDRLLRKLARDALAGRAGEWAGVTRLLRAWLVT